MAKMNISIPDELRHRMQPFDNNKNWSELAAGAFRREVENAEHLASIKSATRRRLRETEIEDVGGVERFAHKNGREWAANSARMIELRRLDKYLNREGFEFESWEALVRVILGDRFGDDQADWFGQNSQFGGDPVEAYEENYAIAFAEGALDVLQEVDSPEQDEPSPTSSGLINSTSSAVPSVRPAKNKPGLINSSGS